MIFDVRTYEVRPGTIGEYVEVFGTYALPVAERHGCKLVGCLTSKVGMLNQVIHIWEYQDLSDFENKRAARDADPGWAVYRSKAHGYLVRQENKIMGGAPFSPLR